MSQENSARATAVEWVSRLALGETTPDEASRLKAWLATDPHHQAEFDLARRKWAELERMRPAPVATRRPRARFAVAAVAAAACALFFALSPILNSHDISSPVGNVHEATLADGSRLWLDTNSAADFHQGASGRTLSIARGRIHIEIAPDDRRPMTVEAAGFVIRDIGTAFSVDTERSGLHIAVTDGEVEVSRGASVVSLTAGHATSFGNGRAGELETFNAADEAAWRNGRIVLNRTTLDEALRQVDRYRRGKVWLLDADGGRQVVSGNIPIDDLEGGLDALATSVGVRLVRLPMLLLVMPADKNKTH